MARGGANDLNAKRESIEEAQAVDLKCDYHMDRIYIGEKSDCSRFSKREKKCAFKVEAMLQLLQSRSFKSNGRVEGGLDLPDRFAPHRQKGTSKLRLRKENGRCRGEDCENGIGTK